MQEADSSGAVKKKKENHKQQSHMNSGGNWNRENPYLVGGWVNSRIKQVRKPLRTFSIKKAEKKMLAAT